MKTKSIKNLAFSVSFIYLMLISFLYGQECSRCHTDLTAKSLPKTTGIFQKAVGVMDKGQLQNNTSNFGNLSSYHVWFTNATHWPRTADLNRQYAFGLGLMVGINKDNVIETETQTGSKIQDWLPPDDALGNEYSGEVTAISDDTPFQASSDLPKSWPNQVWPGYFRVDVNRLDSLTLEEHPDASFLPEARNQFTSDRDIFCTYNDDYNSMGRVGVTVEQSSYSYGRPYAEDFVFWDLKIFNTSNQDLDDIYVGFYAKFRPDYDNHDYIDFIDTDDDGLKDFIYVYDLNNTSDGAWTETNDPLGIVGLRIYDTPFQIGITDFHHFARAASPKTDQEMWALMTSDKSSPDLTDPDYYFHGDLVSIDYTGEDSLDAFYPAWSEEEGEPEMVGNAINYTISCGPFSLKADSMVTFTIGLIMGDAGTVPNNPDTLDLMNNVRTANEMYRLYFQGSAPPDPPEVWAVAGDRMVTLYWNPEPSESSVDVWTGEQDFEGYKIFRSTDHGDTWGRIVTDIYGNAMGYEPLAQFDYTRINDLLLYGVDVSGPDPAFPQNLGSNTGLVHTYIDSNLINGVEYWYCVTAYDRGSQDPDSLVQSYMNAQGASIFESHTVSVIPGIGATNLNYGDLEPKGGFCSGTVNLQIIDPDALTDHWYNITFSDTAIYLDGNDTTFGLGFTIVDINEMDTLYYNHILADDIDTNFYLVDGFLLDFQNSPGGVQSLDWTTVSGDMDTCTFDWRYQSINPNAGAQLIQEDVSTFDDWRITVTYDDSVAITWVDLFSGAIQSEKPYLPIKVEIVTDPDNPRDVTEQCWLGEFAITAPWEAYRKDYYSQLGWDLVPGGKGYTAASRGWYEKHVDVLILESIDTDPATGDTIPNYMYLFTNNKPDSSYNKDGDLEVIDAKAPSDGDQFTIKTYKPFRPGIYYTFGTTAQKVADPALGNPLKNIRVVPDPYVVTNIWESDEFGKKLQFNHLPDQCTIKIYTLTGEHIDTVEHDSPTGYEFWDMRTYNDQFIAPGVYLYYAKTPDGHEAIGRFLVIK